MTCEVDDSVIFSTEEVFGSFSEVEQKLNAYKIKNVCRFWKTDVSPPPENALIGPSSKS